MTYSWLFFQLLTTYGPTRYSAIAGDGGSNVQSAKIKINAEFPWILNVYDPCHNLNLFLKDLGKLFKDVCFYPHFWVKLNTSSLTCFSRCLLLLQVLLITLANQIMALSILMFNEKWREFGRVSKSTSETQFSSSYLQVISVHDCMSPIKKCVASGTLKFDTKAVSASLFSFSKHHSHK